MSTYPHPRPWTTMCMQEQHLWLPFNVWHHYLRALAYLRSLFPCFLIVSPTRISAISLISPLAMAIIGYDRL